MDQNNKIVEATNLPKNQISTKNLAQTIARFKEQNEPIRINFGTGEKILYFSDSPEIKQLIWYPYIQFGVMGLVVVVGYLMFSTFRKAEQNQVWAGMAKETAHQLGTPLSSLMAWLAYLESTNTDPMIVNEMQKDLDRLEKITDRFSKIGSGAKLEESNLCDTVQNVLDYLRPRISDKVSIDLKCSGPIIVRHNAPLMEWVIENIAKNAVDAMSGNGKLTVSAAADGKIYAVMIYNRALTDDEIIQNYTALRGRVSL
jgi:signal transduction histidine kinase